MPVILRVYFFEESFNLDIWEEPHDQKLTGQIQVRGIAERIVYQGSFPK